MLPVPVRASSSLQAGLSQSLQAQTRRHLANLPRHKYSFPPIQRTGGLLFSQTIPCRRRWVSHHIPANVALFHSTQRTQGAPLIPILLGAFKASTTIEVARTAGRIALTFIPLIMFQNRWAKKYIKHHDHFHPGAHVPEEKKALILKCIRLRTLFTHALLIIPAALFWLGIIASMEQTPLTGRWRLIVLSPEEEDEIAAQLAGPMWYQAVTDILSLDGPAKVIPPSDWRYQWVQDTLHKLEGAIPVLQREGESNAHWMDVVPGKPPLPPPADYPLRPRPRAADYVRMLSETLCGRRSTSSAHVIAGPPYSLLIADRPDSANAFSYGFGPDGACGVVVYSGFLDDILSRVPAQNPNQDTSVTARPAREASWLSFLFGSLTTTSPVVPSHSSYRIPTEEQTAELAVLLAHEVAHLVLSHHLETLSSDTIIVPATISMFADVVRTLAFPITMLFGPFINDAIAQLGKVGSRHLTELGGYCTSVKQEVEADVVSERLLALAGFDARNAVAFWESRQNATASAKCSSLPLSDAPSTSWNPARQIMGASHPVNEVRIEKLKSELVRWELEKRVALRWRAEGKDEAEQRSNIWGIFF